MESLPAEYDERTPSLEDDPALGLSDPGEDGDPLRGHARPVPRRPRPDHRRPRAADHRDPARGQRRLRLGRHDLPAHEHDQRPVLGQAVRPLRPEADVHDRHRHLPRRLGAVRPRPGHDPADPLPRHPGHRRRIAVPDRPRRHRRPLLTGRARPLPGPLRRRVRDRVHRGPARRRLPDRADLVALDLLRQPSDRARLAVLHLAAPADGQEPAGHPQLRHPGRGDLHDRHGLPPHRPDPEGADGPGRPTSSTTGPTRPSAGSSSSPSSGSLPSSGPSPGRRSRSSRSTCSATGPTRLRWSRRSSPPSRSSA